MDGCAVFVCICVVYLPAVFQVKDDLVDDFISIQETLDIFNYFLPDRDKHIKAYKY